MESAQMSDDIITIRIGKTFWDDHCDRDCLSDERSCYGDGPRERIYHGPDEYEIKRTKMMVTLTMPAYQVDSLLSDAYHYATGEYETADGLGDLIASARGTARSVLKQLGLPFPSTLMTKKEYRDAEWGIINPTKGEGNE